MITVNQAIGGFFELELPYHEGYHRGAIALNTGRNCLEYILRVRDYRHVYIPYYTCDAVLESIKKLGLSYSFYHINKNFEIESSINLAEGESLLYTNYFGLKDNYVLQLVSFYGDRLIVDNTQAFYAKPIKGIDTFYSCRKFFGVADGGYLYCDKELDATLPKDESWERMTHLLKRIDVSAESAYKDFCNIEELLCGSPIKRMSYLTSRIMKSIDYEIVAKIRRNNYQFLAEHLDTANETSFHLSEYTVPMVYPYLTYHSHLRSMLIDNKIYVAQYWPSVHELCGKDTIEYYLCQNLLPIPIDQRYGEKEIERILDLFS